MLTMCVGLIDPILTLTLMFIAVGLKPTLLALGIYYPQ
jgi:hypothetical protein